MTGPEGKGLSMAWATQGSGTRKTRKFQEKVSEEKTRSRSR